MSSNEAQMKVRKAESPSLSCSKDSSNRSVAGRCQSIQRIQRQKRGKSFWISQLANNKKLQKWKWRESVELKTVCFETWFKLLFENSRDWHWIGRIPRIVCEGIPRYFTQSDANQGVALKYVGSCLLINPPILHAKLTAAIPHESGADSSQNSQQHNAQSLHHRKTQKSGNKTTVTWIGVT
jgi:hypothetical protein